MSTLDITSKAISESKTLHLKDAEDNLLYTEDQGEAGGKAVQRPVTIIIYGPGSTQHAQAAAKRSSRQLEQLRKKGKLNLSADDNQKQEAEWLADITGDFSSNFAYPPAAGMSGREFRLAVFSDRTLGFLGDQITDEVKDWANFSKGSATN